MTYEGWANYQTWNVALIISNEYPLYMGARNYSHTAGKYATYEEFIRYWMPSEYGDITIDGVSWTDPTLDHNELNRFMQEIGE